VSRIAPALRWLARAAVASWLAGSLVALGLAERAPGAARAAAARIEAVPLASEPVGVANAAGPARPRPPRGATPEPLPIGAAELARGSELLDAGAFPVLLASYAEFPSFRDYALAMQALGARLAVVRQRRIVGSVDLERSEVSEAGVAGAFSPRARDYSDEPGLAAAAEAARARFGAGAEVRMLVPRELDAGLFGAIAGVLARHGGDPSAYREIRARYLRAPGGGVRLRVDAAVRRDGAELPMDLLLDLGSISRGDRLAAVRRGAPSRPETAF
jgi:hypothetical protein